LFTFPTKKKTPDAREKWKQLVGRLDGTKLWSPSKDSRVCSRHFVEKQPTLQNPLPTLNMGYDGADKRVKRMIQFDATNPRKASPRVKVKLACPEPELLTASPLHACDPEVDILTKAPFSFPWILTVLTIVLGLCIKVYEQNKTIARLTAEILILKEANTKLKKTVYNDKILKTDQDVNFYTGISKKSIFDKLYSFIAPFVNRRWTGVVSMMKNTRKFKTNARFGPARKMSSKTEFLMMLMKLRLGLLNKDLAKRFDISETLCSRIFFSWLRASCEVLKSSVFMPDEESLIGSKPERFRKLPDLHSIIDCTEFFY